MINAAFKMYGFRNFFISLLLSALALLHACSSAPVNNTALNHSSNTTHSTQQLLQIAKSYLGTPYQFGGNDYRGIDCSGLVRNSFSAIGVAMPRMSKHQAKRGVSISQYQLQKGDLVFFKTGASSVINHVGIMVNSRSFIHSSSSRGVILSSLDNPYWKPRFTQAKRIIH